ncbi:MAG: hypothetical protein LKF48_09710 [Prevotella sp.]|nr:hypothetical protein [Prevotella sp.]MCH4183416.1 hypothetical protein [Prevotella sp.]
MNTYHISYLLALSTALSAILGGERPVVAIQACLRMRRLVNCLYDLGMSPEDIAELVINR